MRSGVAYSVFPSKIDFVDDEHGQIGAAVMNRITSSDHISGPSSGVSAYCFFLGWDNYFISPSLRIVRPGTTHCKYARCPANS